MINILCSYYFIFNIFLYNKCVQLVTYLTLCPHLVPFHILLKYLVIYYMTHYSEFYTELKKVAVKIIYWSSSFNYITHACLKTSFKVSSNTQLCKINIQKAPSPVLCGEVGTDWIKPHTFVRWEMKAGGWSNHHWLVWPWCFTVWHSVPGHLAKSAMPDN